MHVCQRGSKLQVLETERQGRSNPIRFFSSPVSSILAWPSPIQSGPGCFPSGFSWRCGSGSRVPHRSGSRHSRGPRWRAGTVYTAESGQQGSWPVASGGTLTWAGSGHHRHPPPCCPCVPGSESSSLPPGARPDDASGPGLAYVGCGARGAGPPVDVLVVVLLLACRVRQWAGHGARRSHLGGGVPGWRSRSPQAPSAEPQGPGPGGRGPGGRSWPWGGRRRGMGGALARTPEEVAVEVPAGACRSSWWRCGRGRAGQLHSGQTQPERGGTSGHLLNHRGGHYRDNKD